MMKPCKTKILLFLCLAICLSLLAGCTLERGETSWFRVQHEPPYVLRPETPGRMTAYELVQSLVLAVDNRTPVGSIYENIPARQRTGLSLSAFTRYTVLIRRAVKDSVTAIAIPDEDQQAAYVAQTSAQSDVIASLAADSVFFHLRYLDENRRESAFTVAVQIDEEGLPSLTPEWIDAVLRLYDFIELYYSAIVDDNVPALQALLRQGETLPLSDVMDKALENKSHAAISFYDRRVTTAPLDYKLIAVVPGAASVEHYATVSPGSARRENRLVTFSDTNGKVSVNDRVPSELSADDLQIFHNGDKLFTVGSPDDPAVSAEIEARLGIPLSHNDQNCRQQNGQSVFTFHYRGLTLNGEGTCDRHTSWEGTVLAVNLTYSEFALGSGLQVGMPASELYVRYPFARESNYLLTGTINDKEASLAVQVEQGYITKLSLSMTP